MGKNKLLLKDAQDGLNGKMIALKDSISHPFLFLFLHQVFVQGTPRQIREWNVLMFRDESV